MSDFFDKAKKLQENHIDKERINNLINNKRTVKKTSVEEQKEKKEETTENIEQIEKKDEVLEKKPKGKRGRPKKAENEKRSQITITTMQEDYDRYKEEAKIEGFSSVAKLIERAMYEYEKNHNLR